MAQAHNGGQLARRDGFQQNLEQRQDLKQQSPLVRHQASTLPWLRAMGGTWLLLSWLVGRSGGGGSFLAGLTLAWVWQRVVGREGGRRLWCQAAMERCLPSTRRCVGDR